MNERINWILLARCNGNRVCNVLLLHAQVKQLIKIAKGGDNLVLAFFIWFMFIYVAVKSNNDNRPKY